MFPLNDYTPSSQFAATNQPNGKLPFVCAYFNYNLNLAINKIDT